MPERALTARSTLILIPGGLSRSAETSPVKELLRVERYLARQAKAAHNLGVRSLEHYYLTSFLALKLWRMNQEGDKRG